MVKEQIKTNFEFGLTYLNLGKCSLPSNGFKKKDYTKKLGPAWPSFVHFLGDSGLETLNLNGCSMNRNDLELIATSIFENPVSETKLRVLNLSNNAIQKDGAKALAAALEGNKSIEALDLS